MIHFFKQQYHSGFVILFTVIISVIIFMMGLGIYSIALRETTLSSTSREAGQAFYAADAGIECALAAEKKGSFSGGGDITCGGLVIPIPSESPLSFPVVIDSGNPITGSCAIVNVFTPTDGRKIIAQGFNTCENGVPNKNDPRLVERDLDVFYPLGAPAIPVTP